MKRTTFSLLATLLFSVSAFAATPDTTPQLGIRDGWSGPVALTGATIVLSPTERIENGTLVVRDGLVVSTQRGRRVPDGAEEIDASGTVIFPGFVEPFSEYGLGHVGDLNTKQSERRPKYTADREGGQAWNDAIHAERRWADEFQADAKAAEPLLQRGVTVAHSTKRDGIFRGRGVVVSLGSGLANDLIIDASGLPVLSFSKGSSNQNYPNSLMGSIALIRQTLFDASWYEKARKVGGAGGNASGPEFNSALEAITAYDGPVIFETRDDLSLLRAARIGKEHTLPMIHVGSQFEYARIDAIDALDQAIILPVVLPKKPIVDTVEAQLDVSLGNLRHWERAPGNASVLASRGIDFSLTGHNLGKKDDFFGNLRQMIDAGLSRRDALAALTTNPARLLGIDGISGTLQAGKRADFSIWSADPLKSSKAKIKQTWIAGQPAKRFSELDAFDPSGRYSVSFEGQTYDLELKLKKDKLDGELSLGEDSEPISGRLAAGRSASFKANLGDLGGAGVAVFSIVERADALRGYVELPNGSRKAVTLEASDSTDGESEGEEKGEGKKAKKNRKENGKDDPNNDFASRLTYPNIAFGFESLPSSETVHIRDATIWTVDAQGTLEQADIVLRDGKIAAIGKDLKTPRGARVIDAKGRHVTPGIIDEHSHLAISRGVNEGTHAVTAEVRIGDVVNSDDIGIYRALAGGVTAAQLLHGSANPIGGQAQVIKFRWGSSPEEMKFDAAPGSIKFALGENVKQSNWGERFRVRYPQTRMGVDSVMRDTFLAARDYKRAWDEYGALSSDEQSRQVPPRRDLQMDTILEILESERFIHCHSYVQSEILALMRLAEEFDFTVQTFTHILEGYKVAPEMAAHGAGASSFADWWAYKFEVYDAIPYNTCLLNKHGVTTSINSDSGELIRRLNQDAGKSVMYCGMDADEAIKLATLNPAKQLKIDHRVGSLAEGKDADVVLWNGHPLSIFSRVESTWVDGRLLFDRERDAQERQRVAEEKQRLIQKALHSKKGGNGKSWSDSKKEPQWHCDDTEQTHDQEHDHEVTHD